MAYNLKHPLREIIQQLKEKEKKRPLMQLSLDLHAMKVNGFSYQENLKQYTLITNAILICIEVLLMPFERFIKQPSSSTPSEDQEFWFREVEFNKQTILKET